MRSGLLIVTTLIAIATFAQATVVWDPLSDQAPAQWGPQTIVDPLRAGGEPVIVVLPADTILIAAHPSWTLFRGADPYMAFSLTGQSHMWRSIDHGATWSYIVRTADATPTAAHCIGVSDPDFSVAPNGRVSFVELPAPNMAGMSRSLDDGATWGCMASNALSSGQTDRVFLARNDEYVYAIGRVSPYQGAVFRSDDEGASWTFRGASYCSRADIAIGPTGKLYVNCGAHLAISTDGGVSWTNRTIPGAQSGAWMKGTEPALDSAGNVYVAWRNTNATAGDRIMVGWSANDGLTWSSVEVTHRVGIPVGDQIWPVVTAGSAGRVAVTWFGTQGARGPGAEWRVYNAMVSTTGVSPTIRTSTITPDVVHKGDVSDDGFAFGVYVCGPTQIAQNDCAITLPVGAGPDRRMGELFKTAVDKDGKLVVTYPDTEAINNLADPLLPPGISHVGFVRQTGGMQLLVNNADWHLYS